MDHTLPANTQTRRASQRLSQSPRVIYAAIHGIFVIVLALISVSQTGCQSTGMTRAEIPVPPPVLDTAMLESARFQSPDRPQGSGNRVFSRNSALDIGQPQDSQTQREVAVDQANIVADVIVKGNRMTPTHHLMRSIRTRPGRYFDPDKLKQDVDDLWRMPEISRINGPYLNHTPEGVVVTLEVVERNTIGTIEFIGNRGISDRTLKKEIGLEDGKPLDVHEIKMAKTKLEEYYKEKGYPRTQIEIMEGNESSDSKVVFLIHEDEKQRIWKVEFEGNKIASDARLRNFIKSKPGIAKFIGGLVKRDEIEQDLTRLTTYYRSLGFFNARIGREIAESNDGRWMTIQFIIDEGPRYRVRNVSFIGNESYTTEQLKSMVELKPGGETSQPEFNVSKMNHDVVSLRDLYGSQGFVYSRIEAEPRFLEEPGLLDIVYKIEEGKQYVAGNINVHFEGDYGITKREVVLNRLSIRPGDLINVREIRNSERRLGAAEVFANGQTPGGKPPSIVVRPPKLQELERQARGSQGSSFR
jgi:outer membrane protein insertion porin family